MTDKKESKISPNYNALAVENIMRSADGRMYMYEKLQEFLVFDSTFDHDPIQHAFNAGLRAAGLSFERDLKEYAFDFYTKMLKENQ